MADLQHGYVLAEAGNETFISHPLDGDMPSGHITATHQGKVAVTLSPYNINKEICALYKQMGHHVQTDDESGSDQSNWRHVRDQWDQSPIWSLLVSADVLSASRFLSASRRVLGGI